MKKYTLILFITLSISLSLSADANADRLKVVASVFPLYDFARQVAGPDADVRMLLPAGVEPHSWEPKPSDIVAVSKANIFLYVSETMEPWAHNLVSAAGGKDIIFVGVMDNLGFKPAEESHDHSGTDMEHADTRKDPHFWLDLSLSSRAVEAIGKLFADQDPAHREGYEARTKNYTRLLDQLDGAFFKGLRECRTRKFVTGGHSAFGHLADRYELEQISLYGISPDAEPSPAHLISVSRIMRKENLDVVFFEEMVNPRLAEVLASETGAVTMVLNPAGNLTAERINQGVSFVRIMEENLESLRKGLSCE